MKKFSFVMLLSILPIVSCQQKTQPFLATETQEPVISRLETSTVTSTVSSTLPPTLTSTPQPPLIEHEWQPEWVLLSFGFTYGDGGGDLRPPLVPKLILYADGSLFMTRSVGDSSQYRQQLLVKKLERKEICQNLNTLDQIGFLDYDPSNYEFIGGGPFIMGAPSVNMEVNSWKSHRSIYYELGVFLYDELTSKYSDEFLKQGVDVGSRAGFPIVAPALRSAYYFLNNYPEQNFEVYQPERLGVWIIPVSEDWLDGVDKREWLLGEMSLEGFSGKVDNFDAESLNDYLILQEDDAQLVYNYIGQYFSTEYFYEKNKNGEINYYALHARPLLPHELPDVFDSQIPAPNTAKPDFKLKCYPSDGVMPIPTPSIP